MTQLISTLFSFALLALLAATLEWIVRSDRAAIAAALAGRHGGSAPASEEHHAATRKRRVVRV